MRQGNNSYVHRLASSKKYGIWSESYIATILGVNLSDSNLDKFERDWAKDWASRIQDNTRKQERRKHFKKTHSMKIFRKYKVIIPKEINHYLMDLMNTLFEKDYYSHWTDMPFIDDIICLSTSHFTLYLMRHIGNLSIQLNEDQPSGKICNAFSNPKSR